MKPRIEPWIGVDLDGTIAYYDGWKGDDHIGPPIPAMVERVKRYLSAGVLVKIFTARYSDPDPETRAWVVHRIQEWTMQHVGVKLPVTCSKDYACIRIFDDRARQVEENTGRVLGDDDM